MPGDHPEIDFDDPLIPEFVAEAQEHFQSAAGALLTLQSDADDTEALHSVFRSFHTIKGGAGICELGAIGDLAHRAETLLDSARQGHLKLADEALDLSFEALDLLEKLVEGLSQEEAELPEGYEILLERLATFCAKGPSELPVVESPADDEQEIEEVDIDFSDPVIPEFVSEAQEHLQAAEGHLLAMQSSDIDPDAVNAVFRAFHTIKGGGAMLGLVPIGELAHRAETLLDAARSGMITLEGQALDLCFRAVDTLNEMMELVTDAQSPTRCKDYLSLMSSLAAFATHSADDVSEREATAGSSEAATAASEGGASDPFLEDLQAAMLPESNENAANSEPSNPDTVEKDNNEAPAQAAAAASQPVVAVLQAAPQAPSAPKSAATGKADPKSNKKRSDASVKVKTERLDSLVDLVGELVIATAMVRQDVGGDGHQVRSVGHLSKVTTELQAMAMSMRMVPLKATFQRMARLVRDLAGKSGKSVKLEVEGEDTELDRNVVEKLGDPLVHMLRNAVDHGIEDAETRRANGKSETGTLKLRAFHQGGNVVVQLADDGAGIDADRLLAKATERGLLAPGQEREMSPHDIYQLIFHPGLSTAKSVTDVSGRGVGMDVVKKNIEALRGSIDIDSAPGKGTTFTVRLPLTLAIIDGMVVKVGKRTYILPTLSIESFLRPEAQQLRTVEKKGEMLHVRGRILPIFRLHRLFDIEEAIEDPCEALLVILDVEGEACALLVDDLLGQQHVVIKSLGAAMERGPGISGAAVLGDGTVGLILDAAGLARLSQQAPAPALQPC